LGQLPLVDHEGQYQHDDRQDAYDHRYNYGPGGHQALGPGHWVVPMPDGVQDGFHGGAENLPGYAVESAGEHIDNAALPGKLYSPKQYNYSFAQSQEEIIQQYQLQRVPISLSGGGPQGQPAVPGESAQ